MLNKLERFLLSEIFVQALYLSVCIELSTANFATRWQYVLKLCLSNVIWKIIVKIVVKAREKSKHQVIVIFVQSKRFHSWMRRNGTKFWRGMKVQVSFKLYCQIVKGLNKSCLEFCPFCMARAKVREMRWIFKKISCQSKQIYQKYFGLLQN